MNRILIGISLVLLIIAGIYYNKYSSTLKKLSSSSNNVEAFIKENDSLKTNNRVFKFTVEQLNYYNDSVNQKLLDIKKELKIKDKNIEQMQYILSNFTKSDTITFTDTLFVNPSLNIDTVIGDRWYSLKLGLKYPNSITTTPSFTSEMYIMVESKKETIDPPKKFFLLRWFQKKHIINEVTIIDKNPYSEIKQHRFIEITK